MPKATAMLGEHGMGVAQKNNDAIQAPCNKIWRVKRACNTLGLLIDNLCHSGVPLEAQDLAIANGRVLVCVMAIRTQGHAKKLHIFNTHLFVLPLG
jgi:hypothetical protein